MAGEIIYADLRQPGGGSSPAERHHTSAACPRWHGVLLKLSGLGHLVLLVLVAVLSVQGHGGCKLCPQSWHLFRDQCYQVPKSSGTWMQGKKDCESRGSHLAVLRNTTNMELLGEIIRQDKLTVWIGLKASNSTWKWVDNSSFDATTFSSLRNVENGCATFKDKRLDYDGCGGDHKWVCQKEPFHLLSKTAGDGELCDACPEKPTLQDACC
nr:killer cell lectin-like receptor subfamily B member 1B allele B isoform X3 [Anser cygnoides]